MGRFDIYQEKYIKCIENLISKGYQNEYKWPIILFVVTN